MSRFRTPLPSSSFPAGAAALAALVALSLCSVTEGAATIETIAGGGPHDVPADSVWIHPYGIAVDDQGVVYFADRDRSRIYKVDGAGLLRLVAGTGIEADLGDGGPIDRASFLFPEQVGLTPDGSVLIWSGVEEMNCCNTDYPLWNRASLRLRRLNAVTGMSDLILDQWNLGMPAYMTVDAQGIAYFFEWLPWADGYAGVAAVDPDTRIKVHIAGNYDFLGGPLNDGSPATSVSLLYPGSVAIHDPDRLFLSDSEHGRVRVVDLTSGIIDSFPHTLGLGAGAISFDDAGNLFHAQRGLVHRVEAGTGTITVVAGTGTLGFSGDGGHATSAQIDAWRIDLDGGGNLFIMNSGRIRRVDALTGIIDTVAGDPSEDRRGDGGSAAQADIRYPVDVAVADAGDVYIAEAGFSKGLRKIDHATGAISTLLRSGSLAGTCYRCPRAMSAVAIHQGEIYYATYSTLVQDFGWYNEDAVFRFDEMSGESIPVAGIPYPTLPGFNFFPGYSGDEGPATDAQMNGTTDIDFDAAGNLFIADSRNHVIRRVDAGTQIITTYAGGGTETGDGVPARSALLSRPTGIVLDPEGNLYIAETGAHRVRKVTAATGHISTVAGNGSSGYDGDGGPATSAAVGSPERVELDAAGNLYIASGERIRRVDAVTGTISTLAGDGTLGLHGDGGPAAVAALGGPAGMDFDASGRLVFAADDAGRIRRVTIPEPGSVSVDPPLLWPPNHHMVDVVTMVDPGSAPQPVEIRLVSVTSSEPDDAPGGSDGRTVDDVQGAEVGTADLAFSLRAERNTQGAGRVYTIVYTVTDAMGEVTEVAGFVTVPHDLGGAIDPMVLFIDETQDGSVISWLEVPGANSYNVIRGDLGAVGEAGNDIDLGGVECIEARSQDLSTAGDEDTAVPAPGEAFFYLAEYRSPDPSTYGSPWTPMPRVPSSGECP